MSRIPSGPSGVTPSSLLTGPSPGSGRQGVTSGLRPAVVPPASPLRGLPVPQPGTASRPSSNLPSLLQMLSNQRTNRALLNQRTKERSQDREDRAREMEANLLGQAFTNISAFQDEEAGLIGGAVKMVNENPTAFLGERGDDFRARAEVHLNEARRLRYASSVTALSTLSEEIRAGGDLGRTRAFLEDLQTQSRNFSDPGSLGPVTNEEGETLNSVDSAAVDATRATSLDLVFSTMERIVEHTGEIREAKNIAERAIKQKAKNGDFRRKILTGMVTGVTELPTGEVTTEVLSDSIIQALNEGALGGTAQNAFVAIGNAMGAQGAGSFLNNEMGHMFSRLGPLLDDPNSAEAGDSLVLPTVATFMTHVVAPIAMSMAGELSRAPGQEGNKITVGMGEGAITMTLPGQNSKLTEVGKRSLMEFATRVSMIGLALEKVRGYQGMVASEFVGGDLQLVLDAFNEFEEVNGRPIETVVEIRSALAQVVPNLPGMSEFSVELADQMESLRRITEQARGARRLPGTDTVSPPPSSGPPTPGAQPGIMGPPATLAPQGGL